MISNNILKFGELPVVFSDLPRLPVVFSDLPRLPVVFSDLPRLPVVMIRTHVSG